LPESKTYSEPDLVFSLKQKQKDSFEYLYDNYSGALFSVINAIIADRDLASDVLQEVFVKIWKQIETYDSMKGRLFTWMMNIARNSSIDVLRSKNYQKTKQNHELTEAVYEEGGSTNTNIDKIGLRKIVTELKSEYKVLVELSYFEGFTQEEIANMLNIPLGTVKTRLRAALIQLRKTVI
jgi:RNA polymerase sigma factor (sigma-70 family)